MAPRLYLAEYHAIEDFSDEEMEYVADALKRIALPQASHARQVVKIPIAAVGPQMDRFREQYRNLYQENSDEKRGGVA